MKTSKAGFTLCRALRPFLFDRVCAVLRGKARRLVTCSGMQCEPNLDCFVGVSVCPAPVNSLETKRLPPDFIFVHLLIPMLFKILFLFVIRAQSWHCGMQYCTVFLFRQLSSSTTLSSFLCSSHFQRRNLRIACNCILSGFSFRNCSFSLRSQLIKTSCQLCWNCSNEIVFKESVVLC